MMVMIPPIIPMKTKDSGLLSLAILPLGHWLEGLWFPRLWFQDGQRGSGAGSGRTGGSTWSWGAGVERAVSLVGLLLDAAVVDCQGTTYDRQGADSDDETEGFLLHDDDWLWGEKEHKSRNKSMFDGSRCLVTIELRKVMDRTKSIEGI
jgi:hypothetical protein